MMLSSGGFTQRSSTTEDFVHAIEETVLTKEKYFDLQTGIEHRFGEQATQVHDLLYRSMGPTTDLLRYFPDTLYLDRWRIWPTWETRQDKPQLLTTPASKETEGLFTFFVEYKFSYSQRKSPLKGVPVEYIGIIEREAWLAYRRLSNPNPQIGTYLDGKRTLIALFYAATYAPDRLYAAWEHEIEPIHSDPAAIRTDVARPKVRSVSYSTGSGTPWINVDLRQMKPLARFLVEDLYWDIQEADHAVRACKHVMGFPG